MPIATLPARAWPETKCNLVLAFGAGLDCVAPNLIATSVIRSWPDRMLKPPLGEFGIRLETAIMAECANLDGRACNYRYSIPDER